VKQSDSNVELISVVIPMYNAATVIGEQLNALSAQTFRGEWEVVVADNGSTDDSVAIARSFADRLPNLRIVDASGRRGASHARNVGSAAARGDVILYADADDVVTTSWVAALADALRHADFVAGRQDIAALNSRGDRPPSRPWQELPRSFDFLPWAFGGNCGVRTSVWREISGWREDYPHGGDDIDFCWRAQLAGYPLEYVPEAVVRYRERPTYREHVRQQFDFGARAPLLFREFRAHGARRRTPLQVLQTWGGLAIRWPYLFLSTHRRRAWLAGVAGAAGRVWGSIKWRTLCL
jgi:GT2 family glycosyltransferase